MRNQLSFGMLALLVCFPLATAWAGDPNPQPNFCREDSPLCRRLAVEVAILDITDRIDQEVNLRGSFALLCPENDPQCCPPHLMPFCFQIQRDLAREARRAYQSVSLLSFKGCPWSEEICDSFGSFYCGPDKRWLPWAGCVGELEPPINCPSGWKQVGLSCAPPPPCPCGFKHNSKGLCIPKVCYLFGGRVPCRTYCAENQVFVDTAAKRPARSNLGRHLNDRAVQLEAAKRVRENLRVALEALEEELKKLSSY